MFQDTCPQANRAVVHVRDEESSGALSFKLLSFKARLAPIKRMPLLLLELIGALVGTRLLRNISENVFFTATIALY